ncbi:hypothetical protein PO909_007156 [Leuciscus waleckii]
MDVISKEGPLFLQGVKFGKKIWRKSWLILFEPSPAGIGRMELYDMRDGGGLKGFAIARPAGLRKTDKRVIRLTDCLSITPAIGESCPTDCSAFFLNTTSCTYTIAAPSREDWISVLCQLAFQKTQGTEDARKVQKDKYMPMADNQVYSTWGAGQFQVTVQSTDASQRCRMSGSYLLSSEKEAICLLDLKTGQSIYCWPYRLLRRFGQVKGGLMIEAGRRCHTGEGQFIFLSKQGSQIHRAIEEAIMHQSVQELLAQASALPQEFAPLPPSPKSKPQDKSKVKMLPPVSMNQERSLQERLPPPKPLPLAISAPPISPKPKTKPRDRPNVKKHPPANLNQERPCPALSRRNISLPDPPSRVKSPVISPDDVLYSVIFPQPQPQPKPRAKINLPRVATPPSLPQHFGFQMNPDTDVIVEKGKEWKSSQEPSESSDDEAPSYTNWTAKTTAEQDQPNIEDLYSKVNFASKLKNRQNENNDDQEQPNADQQTPVITSSEIPVDFKQTLSSILFRERSKMQPPFPSRSHGGSCDQIDNIDEEMTD